MAVAVYQYRPKGREELHEDFGPRGFHPPKRAGELKYWYKAVKKVMPQIPCWLDSFIGVAEVEVETIEFQLPDGTLWISRKRHLR